jgi:hypothetical protein
MNPSLRKWIAPVVLLLALGFVALTYDSAEDESKIEVVAPAPKKETSAKNEVKLQPGELDLARLARRAEKNEPGNAFESLSWYQAPVRVRKEYQPEALPPPRSALPNPIPILPIAAAAPPPPPKPVAPPVPFTYLGTFQDSGKPTFFLVKGDQVYHVREGDVIEGTYRVEGVEGPTLKLLYLPLNIRQTINVGQAG